MTEVSGELGCGFVGKGTYDMAVLLDSGMGAGGWGEVCTGELQP